MNIITSHAITLATHCEPIARERGYHTCLTGSALYGRLHHNLEREQDIDIAFYWHGGVKPSVSEEDLVFDLGFPDAEVLSLPEGAVDRGYPQSRGIFEARWGEYKVNFIFLRI